MRRLLPALAVGLLVGIAPGFQSAEDPAELFRVVFFDVGQGDAVLLEAPAGQRVLIDAGPDEKIVDLLRREGVDSLDLFVATHNHADHIGGASAVLREFPVRFFMDNGVAHTTATYRRMLEALRDRRVPLLEPEGRQFRLGEATLEILPPPGDADLGHNDNSVGAILRFGDFRATFPGDAERRLWEHWLESNREALSRVQLHKASHHGSKNGDTAAAIEGLRPELVVVSAGEDNPFGHPHEEALALYEAAGARIVDTGEQGRVVVLGGADGSVRVETARRFRKSPSRTMLTNACAADHRPLARGLGEGRRGAGRDGTRREGRAREGAEVARP